MINWIKTDERLPDESQRLLIRDSNTHIGYFEISQGRFYLDLDEDFIEAPTYWAALSDINVPE
jgi:hypothetical protein